MTSRQSVTAGSRLGRAVRRSCLALCALAVAALVLATPAFAGQASTGQLYFYPCTTCHPVRMVPGPTPGTEVPSRPLPNGFTGHTIVLEVHDKLAAPGGEPCLVCHDDPTRNPGKLKLLDGTFIDVNGDVAKFCYQCHEAKYKEFVAGTHGKHQPKCTSAGCHDPHTPGYIYAGALPPFTGTGFQFKVLPVRVPFKPILGVPIQPPTITPTWFLICLAIGLLAVVVLAAGLIGPVVSERLKR